MSYFPNLRTSGTAVIPTSYPYSDVLFDYAAFLRSADAAGSIAKYSGPDDVAVIGSGAAAVTAAYELSRAGVNVFLFSPDWSQDRAGRCYSQSFPNEGSPITEMGAMRFPPSEVCLFHYMQKFGIKYTDNFPDPGKVDTLLHAGGVNYEWKAGDKVPAIFEKIRNGLDALVSGGVTLSGGQRLAAPSEIAADLKAGKLDTAKSKWQEWITSFEPFSFRSAITLIFQQDDSSHVPGGYRWTDDDIRLFGTLGVGSGGFGPLFSIGFLEIARLFVNELETDQQFVPGGIASVFYAMIEDRGLRQHILPATICSVTKQSDGTFTLTDDGGKEYKAFSAVVATPSNWSLPFSSNLVSSATPSLLSETEKAALRNQHIITSSKVFVVTQDKFWLKQNLPANIQTDTLARGVYCLDYSPGDENQPGVVLVSYTWQDDSAKQLASAEGGSIIDRNKARLTELSNDIAGFLPEFAKYLIPKDDDYSKNVQVVDWMLEPNYRGAFKLNLPGQGSETAAVFLNFRKAGTEDDSGIYLAGDGSSFYGGWVEGALQTGLNAATAVLKHLGAENFVESNPLNGIKTGEYDYSTGQ